MTRRIIACGLAAAIWIAAVVLAPDTPSRIMAAVTVAVLISGVVATALEDRRRQQARRGAPGS